MDERVVLRPEFLGQIESLVEDIGGELLASKILEIVLDLIAGKGDGLVVVHLLQQEQVELLDVVSQLRR